MLSIRICIVSIEVDQEHGKKAIPTVTNEVLKVLAQFLSLDITV